MPIAVNKNTAQTPMSTLGLTGSQSIKLIPAPRVYVKSADPTVNAPVQNYYTKSNGVTPTGWTDLGIVDGNFKVTYDKKTTEVRTGIDNYLRNAYTSEKTATVDFSLLQFDDVVLQTISGLTGSVITSGSVVNYQIGQDDLNPMAILLVVQNKLDGKEWQFYNPKALLNFSFDDTKDALMLKVNGILPFFTANGQTTESLLSSTVFA